MSMKEPYMLRCRVNRDTHACDDLRLLGIDVWAGKMLVGTPDPNRGAKNGKRAYVWTEHFAYPTYIFADLAIYDYHRAMALKDIWHIDRVPYSMEKNLRMVQNRVDEELKAAQKRMERQEAPKPSFTPGELLEAVGGPLNGLMGPFREVTTGPDGWHVEVDGPMGRVKLSPQHVRKAG